MPLKILLVGGEGCGKTEFIKRANLGADNGIALMEQQLTTQEDLGSCLQSQEYDALIIMLECATTRFFLQSLTFYENGLASLDATRVNVPLYIVVTKCDSVDHKVRASFDEVIRVSMPSRGEKFSYCGWFEACSLPQYDSCQREFDQIMTTINDFIASVARTVLSAQGKDQKNDQGKEEGKPSLYDQPVVTHASKTAGFWKWLTEGVRHGFDPLGGPPPPGCI